ncbi:hypothetical protein AMJ80_03265 [bacterium SM23_31]|nr:MAG: hypothetical protein AMJ80_03265 [bacterium SM23_31]
MRNLLVYISFLLLSIFLYCTEEPEFRYIEPEVILPNVLKYELAFGSDETKLPEEFLLVEPFLYGGIAVNDSGDIYVTDESCVKVYDSNGNHKKLIGGSGLGPGEFYMAGIPTISPSGYLTVYNKSWIGMDRINIFSSDDKFIKSVNYTGNRVFREVKYKSISESKYYWENIGRNFQELKKGFSLDINERVLSTSDLYDRDQSEGYNVLYYENADTMFIIKQFEKWGEFFDQEGMLFASWWYGDFTWDVLPDRIIIYINSGPLELNERGEPCYTLHILSLESFKDKEISQPYNPIVIPDSVLNSGGEGYSPPKAGEIARVVKELLSERKYYASVQKLLVDGYYVFAFTMQKNEAGESLVDVFDMKQEKYLHSAYFSVIPYIIKNGYAYKTGRDEEGFSIIEKYKIDPAVYGK